MNKDSLMVALVLSVGLHSLPSWGAPSSKQKKASVRSTSKNRASAPVDKSKTIADILKKIEKKSQSVQFNKGDSALPQFQAQQSAAANKVNLKDVKPPRSSQLYFDKGTDEAELLKVTDEGINQLYKLTNQYSKSSKRGELWLRLAELYVEKARLIEFQLLNKHDAKMQEFLAGKIKTRPLLNLSAATEYNKKAIQLYEWFLRDFPKDPKVDQALFFLGFNYFELKQPKKGETYYVRLTKEFPNSLYVSESNFALGEYHFENEKWKDSLIYYSRVAAQKNSRLYTFALYKMAWSEYKLNNSKAGLQYLEQVILEGRRSKGQKDKTIGGVSRIRLATEAIKDLIVFYAEAGDVTKARSYFEQVVGEKSANANLARLAYFYSDTGNREKAQFMFKDLIEQDPNSVKAYDYQYAIVKMYGTTGATKGFKEQLYEWISTYGPGSSWQKINEQDHEAIKKANELMESLLRNNVLQQHQVAQNSRTKSSQATARAGYELYFSTFQQAPKIDEMHFYYGELLFDMNDFEKAATHYNWVVENSPKSIYYEKSLLNSLLSYEKRLPSEDKIKKLVGESVEPIEFTPDIKAFESAAVRFLDKSPKSENAVAARYRLGALYYLFNQFDKATPILSDIVKKHSKSQYAKFSANHLLDIYNLKKDYVGLQEAADKILSIPELAHSDIGAQIRDIKLKTDFKLAKDLEDKKDFAGSGRAYEEFAMKNKASELAPAALFNSAVNYERAGQATKAISLYILVAGNKAKGSAQFADQSNRFLPVLYEKTGQYAKAAKHFEQLAKQFPKDPLSDDYHYNAAIIYDGLNAWGSAIENYDQYFAKHKGADKVEVLFLIAKIYERTGQTDKAIAQYDKYLKSGTKNHVGIVESTYKIAKLHEKMGRQRVTDEWYQNTVAVQKRFASSGHPVGAAYAAEARLKGVYKTYLNLITTRIPANPAKQSAAVQNKLAFTNRLKDQLKSVIAYDDAPQIVAALTLQGQALQHMYESILNSQAPQGLTPEEAKQYREGIKKIADPFKVQAIETYSTAVARGYELQGYNDALKVAIKSLNKLKGTVDHASQAEVILTQIPDGMDI